MTRAVRMGNNSKRSPVFPYYLFEDSVSSEMRDEVCVNRTHEPEYGYRTRPMRAEVSSLTDVTDLLVGSYQGSFIGPCKDPLMELARRNARC